MSRCLLNSYGEIGSVYPSTRMSMIAIGVSLLYLDKRWCCLLYNVYLPLDDWYLTGSKYLEYISRIRTEHTLINLNTEQKNQIELKESNWTKSTASNETLNRIKGTEQTKVKQFITGNKQYRHWLKSVSFKRSWIVTVQHFLGLNIFAITEMTIANPVCLNVKCVKSNVLTRTSLPFQQAETS